jgi:hypothetical protein
MIKIKEHYHKAVNAATVVEVMYLMLIMNTESDIDMLWLKPILSILLHWKGIPRQAYNKVADFEVRSTDFTSMSKISYPVCEVQIT